jgi:hypothetical protein
LIGRRCNLPVKKEGCNSKCGEKQSQNSKGKKPENAPHDGAIKNNKALKIPGRQQATRFTSIGKRNLFRGHI